MNTAQKSTVARQQADGRRHRTKVLPGSRGSGATLETERKVSLDFWDGFIILVRFFVI